MALQFDHTPISPGCRPPAPECLSPEGSRKGEPRSAAFMITISLQAASLSEADHNFFADLRRQLIMAFGVFNYTAEEVSANPSIISSRTISGAEWRDLRLENVTLSKTTFNKVKVDQFHFENVIFENCSFINCEFHGEYPTEGILENVVFNGGVMSNTSRQEVAYRRAGIYKVDWQDIKVNRIVLDGVRMHGARLYGIFGGSVTLKNLANFENYETGRYILSGRNIKLRIDNCQLDGKDDMIQLCSLEGDEPDQIPSTIYVTNSKFADGHGLGGSIIKALYVDNCEFTDLARLGRPQEIAVVKNSVLCALMNGGVYADVYFITNKFVTYYMSQFAIEVPTVLDCKNMYFLNDEMGMTSAADSKEVRQPIAVSIAGSRVNIYDIDLQNSTFFSDIDYLNLRNVKILGGEWKNLNVKGGHWENVEIHAPIEIRGTAPQFGDEVIFYNVTFPQGSPFDTEVNFSAKVSKQPFDWPKVHVPTLAEMGLDPD
jgi:uncharacterized protein YjbI with pentapeptide repeats